MVGLIGSGQEIFRGEERGMEQWNEALRKMPSSWTVQCTALDAQGKPLAELFTAAGSVKIDEALGLSRSLRSHLALDLSTSDKRLPGASHERSRWDDYLCPRSEE